MELIHPTPEQNIRIQEDRRAVAEVMHKAEPDKQLLVLAGPCAADADTMPDGTFATSEHVDSLHQASQDLHKILFIGRLAGTKPRTNTGATGLIHAGSHGPRAYTELASTMAGRRGIRLSAEVLDATDALVAMPWMSAVWTGARNVEDTTVRYLVRPSQEDIEKGDHAVPVFVKNGTSGTLDTAVHALHTIRSETPQTRLTATKDGLRMATTVGNPHTGLILRGGGTLPDTKNPADHLAEEVLSAHDRLTREFGAIAIPIVIDISHGNAARFGGGEVGQLACAQVVLELLQNPSVPVSGIMAETYVVPGKQPPDGTTVGQSKTDACIGQEAATGMLHSINMVLKKEYSIV
jgi:phospho-2-dehydro-3-deoxyheptonate aldolase